MSMIAVELKKIWTMKILAVIVVTCALFYVLGMHHHIRWYQGDRYVSMSYFAHHLTRNYGTTLSPEDFEDFLHYREGIVAALDLFIHGHPTFVGAGIYNFEDYENFRRDLGDIYFYHTPEERQLWIDVALAWGTTVRTEINGETVDISSPYETPMAHTKMFFFNNLVGIYEANVLGMREWGTWIDSFIDRHPLTQREQQRLEDIRDSGELLGIMAQATMRTTWEYWRDLATLAILVTLILVSSLVTRDHASKIHWLQYTSKTGRAVLTKQLLAIIISAVLVTTGVIVVFGGIFSRLGMWGLWHNGINSFMSTPFHWLSITYGQYILLLVGVVYVLAIAAGMIAFALSRFSQNMVRLMFKVIPFFVVSQIFSRWVLSDFLGVYVGGNIFAQFAGVVGGFLLATAIAVCIVYREKRWEIQ